MFRKLLLGIVASMCVGVGESALADTPAAYVNNSMDNEFVWLEQGASSLYPTKGLPHWGIINGTSDPASTFLLQPYTANNVLLVQPVSVPPAIPGVQTGTMSFVTPTLANSLAFATASGFGSNTVGITVHFADATPDFVSTITSPDWERSPTYVTATAARIRINNDFADPTGYEEGTGDIWRIGEVTVSLGLPTAHPVSSVDFTWLATQSFDSTFYHKAAIFGISTSTVAGGPYTAANLTANSFNADVVAEAVPEPMVGLSVGCVAILVGRRKRDSASL